MNCREPAPRRGFLRFGPWRPMPGAVLCLASCGPALWPNRRCHGPAAPRRGKTVGHTPGLFVGLDVSLAEAHVRALGAAGARVLDASMPSDPDAFADVLSREAPGCTSIANGTGAAMPWFWRKLRKRGIPVTGADVRNVPPRHGQSSRVGLQRHMRAFRGGAHACLVSDLPVQIVAEIKMIPAILTRLEQCGQVQYLHGALREGADALLAQL